MLGSAVKEIEVTEVSKDKIEATKISSSVLLEDLPVRFPFEQPSFVRNIFN